MHPQGMVGDKPRLKLSEIPGNPAYALAQVYDVLMSYTDVEELVRDVGEVMEPFNPLAALERGRAKYQAALSAGVALELSEEEVRGIMEAAVAKDKPTTKTTTGMSVDHFARFMDTVQQLAWADPGPGPMGQPVVRVQSFITNFILKADGLGVVGGHRGSGFDRPRYSGPGERVATGPRNRFTMGVGRS